MIALSRHSSIAKAAVPAVYRLFNITLSRFFSTASSAAEAQLDPDYYYYNEPPRRNQLGAMDDTENSVPGRGVQWAFIGSPRAKKRVYAETLSKLLEVPCISMASLARQELNPRSSLYKQIANAVNRRMLVPEDIIFGLLSKRLEDGYYKGETGFILDGIPRSRLQAKYLFLGVFLWDRGRIVYVVESTLPDTDLSDLFSFSFESVKEILDQLVEIDLVVNFRCTDDYLVKHQQEGVWKESVYAEQDQYSLPWDILKFLLSPQSKPLEDYYQKQKRLLDFQVGSAPAENWQGLLAALHLQHINAACSSKKPTTSSSML
ncbi:hypothetical protein POTOM_049558 [Populus tomentosa]|uniref:Adenylate kinase n=1 Tax=Populus tomentosa TaxID=118781 RepID=A0A8X7YCP1_POPTO|nr:hypothetical protein POTOM_049558 [Populus tomentosa]